MKRILILLITTIMAHSIYAQTDKEMDEWFQKGTTADKSGNYQEAIQYFEIIKNSFEKTNKKDKVYGDILFILSNCYTKLSDYSKAVEYGTKAMEIRKATLGETHPDYASSLGSLAQKYTILGDYSTAMVYGTKALEIQKTAVGENHPDYATTLGLLAQCYSYLGDYDKALEYETKAMEIFRVTLGESHSFFATSLTNLAQLYSDIGDYSKAIVYGTRAKDVYKVSLGDNHPFFAASLNSLAQSHFYLGDYSTAVEYGMQAISILKSVIGENPLLYIQTLDILVQSYCQLGDYSKAVEYGTKACELFENILGENHRDYVMLLVHLSTCYSFLSNYAKAVEYGTKALKICKAVFGENHPDSAKPLNILAQCYYKLGDYSKALDNETKAMKIYKKTLGENHPDYAKSLNNLTLYHFTLGDYVKAVEYGIKAKNIYETVLGENHPEYAKLLSNLSNCFVFLGENAKAIEYGTKAVEISKVAIGENNPQYATCLNNLAQYYSYVGDYTKEMEYSIKAMEIRKSVLGENHPDYATSLNNIGVSCALLGDIPKAVDYVSKAMDIYKRTLGWNHPETANTLDNLAFFHLALRNYSKALVYCIEYVSILEDNTLRQFTNLTTSQRSTLWNKNSYKFTSFYPLVTAASNTTTKQNTAGDLYDKTALFAKGLLLTTEMEMNKLILESGDEEALKMFEELRNQRLQLQKLYEIPIAERHINADSMAQVANQLESQLVKRSKVYGDFTRKLRTTWKDVQAALGKDEIAVEFLSFHVYGTDSTMVAALTLRKDDKEPKFYPLFEQGQVEALDSKDHFIRSEVTELVWKPLQEELDGIRRIYFSPAGILHRIGIEYLPGMEGYDLRRLSTTREIIDIKEGNGKNLPDNAMATLYGGINYEEASIESKFPKGNLDGDVSDDTSKSVSISLHRALVDSLGLRGGRYNYLPGTLAEVENIKASFEESHRQAGMLTGADATETSVRSLSSRAPEILHIATHGFYYTEKEKRMMDIRKSLMQNEGLLGAAEKEDKALTRSGLLLAGANKTLKGASVPMDEDDGILTAQEISKLDLRGTDLVVLSACETGKGDINQGEGVFGLQRGFKKAGVGTIVMSLWKVNDTATEMMMTQFYKNLCAGKGKYEALHAAQKHVREYKDEEGEKIFDDPLYWAGFIILD